MLSRSLLLFLAFSLCSPRTYGVGPANWPKLDGDKVSVIFVEGFLNETMFNNFKFNEETLSRVFGVERVHKVSPKSVHSVTEGAQTIGNEVRRIHSLEKKPVILIGHSKGAVECLYAMMTDISLTRPVQKSAPQGVVAHAVLLQGAIGGSPLVEPLVALRITQWLSWWAGSAVEKYATDFLLSTPLKGFMTLSPTVLKPILEQALAGLKESPADFDRVNPRIHYVRSIQQPGLQSEILAGGGLFLDKFYGQNDGMVLYKDQILEGIGSDLFKEPLNADHADLVSWGRAITNSSPEEKIEFTIKTFSHFLNRVP
jgi:hypothetical protein